jgi:hypothetical protein
MHPFNPEHAGTDFVGHYRIQFSAMAKHYRFTRRRR